jgi:hypothetical protein
MVTLASLDSPSPCGLPPTRGDGHAPGAPPGDGALSRPPSNEPRRGTAINLGVEDPNSGTCHPPNRHDRMLSGPWRSEAWPRLTTRGQIDNPPSCSSHSIPPEPPPPSPDRQPLPSIPSDPPLSHSNQISTGSPNPNPSNPPCSSGRSNLVAAPADSKLGGFDLSHLWGRSYRSGRCQVVSTPADPSKCSTQALPLGGSSSRWSTLGGDSRSFAQVLQTPLKHRQVRMENREEHERRGYGGEGERGEAREEQDS